MNYTTIEQSKKLLELGLSPETADMVYYINVDRTAAVKLDSEYPYVVRFNQPLMVKRYGIPCWSLGALLDLLRRYNDCNKLDIFSNRSQKWQITISYYDIVWKEHEEINISLLEASYNTVIWLLENGYIKTEKK